MKMLNKLIVSTPYRTGSDRKFTANDLQKLIDKYSRRQRKSRDAHQALLKALQLWLADLPNDSTVAMVQQLTELMEEVAFVHAHHLERLNGLKVQLGSVATREARQLTLLKKHDVLQRSHDTVAVKHGPQSKQAALVIDEIEENEYNLKLIEQQLARTADAGMREVSLDYLAWFQMSLFKLGKLSNSLANTLRESEQPLSGIPRSLALDSGNTFDGGPDSGKMSSATLNNPDSAAEHGANLQKRAQNHDTGSVLKSASTGGNYGNPYLESAENPYRDLAARKDHYEGGTHEARYTEESLLRPWIHNGSEDSFRGLEAWR